MTTPVSAGTCHHRGGAGGAGDDPLATILESYSHERSGLIGLLQAAQDAAGYLSSDAIRRIARRLRLSESDVYGVATFYAQFRFSPAGRHVLRVCLGTACHVKGGLQIMETVERHLGVGAGEATPDGEYEVERVACMGCCAQAPVVTLDDRIHGQMNVLRLQELLDGPVEA